MKKQLIKRGCSGFIIGVAIGFIISLLISIGIGDGSFYPVRPELIDKMGNELNAVLFQTALCGVLGSGFSMAALVWEMDAWSLAKQTGVYFAIICAVMFPVAYSANWMHHSLAGVLSYFGIFVLIFALAWGVQYALWKGKIKRMNDTVKK